MIVICLQADTSEMEINPRKTVCGCPSGGVMNSHTRNPLTVWSVFVSVHFVLSLCGLSVYTCPLTVWSVFVSVQLSSHCVECIC